MAYAPQDVYQIATDPGLSPAEKQAAIDALGSAEAPAAPDARLAYDPTAPFGSVESVPDATQQPGPTPVASDVGPSMSVAPAASAAPAPPSVAAPPPPPGANMSTPTGEAVTAAAPPVAGPEPMPMPMQQMGLTPEQRGDLAVNRAIVSAAIPRAGGVVPERVQHGPTVREGQGPINPVYEGEVRAREGIEAETMRDAGEQDAKAHLDQAILADQQAKDSAAQQAAAKAKNDADNEHLRQMDEQHAKLTKDLEIAPDAYWSSKNALGKIVSVIGGFMLGFGGRPELVNQIIKDDMDRRALERDKQLSASHQNIEDFKSRMLSPEAANQMDLSLGQQAAAATARRMSETAQSSEARLKGEQMAEQLEAESARNAMAAAQKQAGMVKTTELVVPKHVVAGETKEQAEARAAKELKLTPEQVIRQQAGEIGFVPTQEQQGQMALEGAKAEKQQAQDNEKRQVEFVMPDGRVESRTVHAENLVQPYQEQSNAIANYRSALNNVRTEVEKAHAARTVLDRATVNRLQANVKAAGLLLKGALGQNAPRIGVEQDSLDALSGGGATEWYAADTNSIAAVREAINQSNGWQANLMKTTREGAAQNQAGGGEINFKPAGVR